MKEYTEEEFNQLSADERGDGKFEAVPQIWDGECWNDQWLYGLPYNVHKKYRIIFRAKSERGAILNLKNAGISDFTIHSVFKHLRLSREQGFILESLIKYERWLWHSNGLNEGTASVQDAIKEALGI